MEISLSLKSKAPFKCQGGMRGLSCSPLSMELFGCLMGVHFAASLTSTLSASPFQTSGLEWKYESVIRSVCPTLCDPMGYSPPGSSVLGILQARTAVGCHFLLQGIFLTQGTNPGLLPYRPTLHLLNHREYQVKRALPNSSGAWSGPCSDPKWPWSWLSTFILCAFLSARQGQVRCLPDS